MARRFRFLSLPEDQRSKISNFLSQYVSTSEDPNLHNKVLDAIEKTGNIPDEYLAGITGGRASVDKEIGSILAALPTHKKAREDYIASQKDETGLTDVELEDRKQAFQGLSGEANTLDRGTVNSRIKGLLSKNKVPELIDMNAGDNTLSNILTDFVTANHRLPDYFEFENIAQGKNKDPQYQQMVRQLKGNGAFANFLKNQDVTNEISGLTTRKDSNPDVSRIQDILNSRMSEGEKQAALEQFLAETPNALKADREDYLASQEDLAGSYLKERAIPNILRDLNMRGTIDSPGEFASALSVEAGGLQGRIEETARTLEEQDNIFFADAAYRLQISKLEASEQDYRSQVAAERTRVRQAQGKNFASREGQLARDFESDILRWEQDRALNLRRSELNFDSSRSSSDIRTSLLSDTASSSANLIGNKLIYGGREEKEQTPSEKTSGAPPLTVKPVPKVIG